MSYQRQFSYLAGAINHDLFSILLRVSLNLLLNGPNIDSIYQIKYCGMGDNIYSHWSCQHINKRM